MSATCRVLLTRERERGTEHVPKALGEWRGLQREQEPPEQLSTGPWGSPEAALNFTIQLWAHQPCLGFRVTTAPLSSSSVL